MKTAVVELNGLKATAYEVAPAVPGVKPWITVCAPSGTHPRTLEALVAMGEAAIRAMDNERIQLRESGNWLHVLKYEDSWQVFLNSTDVDEIYLGGGPTRDAAVAEAVETLEEAIGKLKEDDRENGLRSKEQDRSKDTH
jgi:hypothetical protein